MYVKPRQSVCIRRKQLQTKIGWSAFAISLFDILLIKKFDIVKTMPNFLRWRNHLQKIISFRQLVVTIQLLL